jgi:hypothetical protein
MDCYRYVSDYDRFRNGLTTKMTTVLGRNFELSMVVKGLVFRYQVLNSSEELMRSTERHLNAGHTPWTGRRC